MFHQKTSSATRSQTGIQTVSVILLEFLLNNQEPEKSKVKKFVIVVHIIQANLGERTKDSQEKYFLQQI